MKKDLYLSNSKIAGRGVFTRKAFRKGEITFILKGNVKKLYVKSSKDSAIGPNWVGLNKGIWIDPDGLAQYLNHSCDPNMGIKGKVIFVALRNIKPNEELTFDYSTTEDDIFWKFKCNCGARKCRKVLYSIQYLPKPVFEKYLPYVPTYFQKVYNKHNKLGTNNG